LYRYEEAERLELQRLIEEERGRKEVGLYKL
jgi:hypothetical protein